MTVLAIAHRAGNSLPQLREALDAGVDIVEADIHSHRGRLEVRHLKTMGPLPFLWDRWELVPAWAPRLLLQEVLAAADANTTLMLDLKGRRAEAGAAAARALHTHAPERAVVVCGRYWPAVEALGHLSWVRSVFSARNPRELSRLQAKLRRDGPAYGVSLHRSLLDKRTVASLHRRAEVVMTWPVNDEPSLDEALDVGVTGVISDQIDVLRQLMERR